MRATRGSLVAILVMGSLVGPLDGTAAQDEAEGSAYLGGRVEVPEGGFAMTFPEGWQPMRTTITGVNGLVETYGISEGMADAVVALGDVGITLWSQHDTLDAGYCTVGDSSADQWPLGVNYVYQYLR